MLEQIAKPGSVVWAAIGNPFENPSCEFKGRPAVLIRRERGHWVAAGCTTQPMYKSTGTARIAIPNPALNGLHEPGWIWTDEHTTRVSALDIGDHIGWVDHALVTVLSQIPGVYATDVQRLRSVASLNENQFGLAA